MYSNLYFFTLIIISITIKLKFNQYYYKYFLWCLELHRVMNGCELKYRSVVEVLFYGIIFQGVDWQEQCSVRYFSLYAQISRIAYGICGGYEMACYRCQGLNELVSESVMEILLPKAGLNGPGLQEYELPMTEAQHLCFFTLLIQNN